ncbi:MAG: antibiotic acetyltransferase, partial [Pseudomonadota bacterium]
MPFPPPTTRHPVTLPDGSTYTGTVFLKTALSHPRIDVGDYTYYSDFEMPEAPGAIASRIAPYLFEGSPERLRIGKFCQIAHGTQFITASANHRYDGFSSYPFAIFDGMDRSRPSMPGAFPDTVVGHDCWFGHGATILPGARIGHGVIIGAGAVVG